MRNRRQSSSWLLLCMSQKHEQAIHPQMKIVQKLVTRWYDSMCVVLGWDVCVDFRERGPASCYVTKHNPTSMMQNMLDLAQFDNVWVSSLPLLSIVSQMSTSEKWTAREQFASEWYCVSNTFFKLKRSKLFRQLASTLTLLFLVRVKLSSRKRPQDPNICPSHSWCLWNVKR